MNTESDALALSSCRAGEEAKHFGIERREAQRVRWNVLLKHRVSVSMAALASLLIIFPSVAGAQIIEFAIPSVNA